MDIIISAVVGIILGVILEDPLTAIKDRAIRQYKRFFYKRPERLQTSAKFSFGSRQTSWVIVDGNGEEEYSPKTIISHFENHPVQLPTELEAIKHTIKKAEEAKKKKGLPFGWNGDRYCLERFSVTRLGTDEDMGINFWFRPTDYYTFLATNMQLDKKELQDMYVKDADWATPIKYFSNSFGVNLCVITSDEYLIIPRRSGKVGVNKGMYHISVNEGLSRSLDRSTDSQAPNMYRCGIRGIAEELGVTDVTANEITFLSFGVDTTYAQWALLGFAKVDKTAQEVLDWRARGVKDKWESEEFHMVKFTVKDVVTFVSTHQPWTPAGLACIYQTLVHEFERKHVDQAIEKQLKV